MAGRRSASICMAVAIFGWWRTGRSMVLLPFGIFFFSILAQLLHSLTNVFHGLVGGAAHSFLAIADELLQGGRVIARKGLCLQVEFFIVIVKVANDVER